MSIVQGYRNLLFLIVALATSHAHAAKKCSDYAKDLASSSSQDDFARAMQKVSSDIPIEEASRTFSLVFEEGSGASTEILETRGALNRFLELQIIPRVKAIKGSHIRNNSVCMKNFQKVLGLAWSFQLFGVWSDSESRKKDGKELQDFPFDILANTALLIWIQSEITCSTTRSSSAHPSNTPKSFKEWIAQAAKVDRQAVKKYMLDSAIRWRELMITIPFGLGSYIFFATSEDFIRREIDLQKDGESDRPSIWTSDYLKEFLNHAVFISVFESLLFARMAGLNAPLELSVLPKFQALMKTKGLRSVGVGLEWAAYRIPLGLFDGKVVIWWKGKSAEVIQSLNFSGDLPEDLLDNSLDLELQRSFDPRRIGEDRE